MHPSFSLSLLGSVLHISALRAAAEESKHLAATVFFPVIGGDVRALRYSRRGSGKESAVPRLPYQDSLQRDSTVRQHSVVRNLSSSNRDLYQSG